MQNKSSVLKSYTLIG